MALHPGFEGGCFCGAIRYRAEHHQGHISHCHCEHCQRSSGGAFLTWVPVRREHFEWTEGEPRRYRHRSDWATGITRTFCDRCGTSLTYERDGADELDLTAVSMDHPDTIEPQRHVYASRQRCWVHLDDGLPRNSTLPSRDDNRLLD